MDSVSVIRYLSLSPVTIIYGFSLSVTRVSLLDWDLGQILSCPKFSLSLFPTLACINDGNEIELVHVIESNFC